MGLRLPILAFAQEVLSHKSSPGGIRAMCMRLAKDPTIQEEAEVVEVDDPAEPQEQAARVAVASGGPRPSSSRDTTQGQIDALFIRCAEAVAPSYYRLTETPKG